MELIIYAIIFLIALLISLFCSMIGIGGNSIFIPILLFFTGIDYLRIVIATLLFTSIFKATSATTVYAKEKVVDYKLAIILLTTISLGTLLASQVSILIDLQLLGIILAIVLITIAGYMILSNYFHFFNNPMKCDFNNTEIRRYYWKRIFKIKNEEFIYLVNLPFALIISFFSGFIVGLTGIAGGIIMVPILHLGCGVPMILTVGTSFFIIIFTGLFATIGYLPLGLIDFYLATPIILGLIIGSQIGSRFALKLKQENLKVLFGFVLLIISMITLIQFL